MTAVLNGNAAGAPLSDATPAAPGTAAAGVSTSASRGDHVHTPTTAAQVGLGAVTATGADAAAARLSIAYDYPADSTAYLIARLNDASGNPTLRVDPGGVTAAVAGTWVYSSGGVYRDRGGMRHDEAGATSDCLTFTGLSVNTATTSFTITTWVSVGTPASGAASGRYFLSLWDDNTTNPANGVTLGRNAITIGDFVGIPRRAGADGGIGTGIPEITQGVPIGVPLLYGMSWDRVAGTCTTWIGGTRSTAGATFGGNMGTLTTLVVGNVRVRNRPTNGTYGEVRIYKSILTAAQMAQLAADHARV